MVGAQLYPWQLWPHPIQDMNAVRSIHRSRETVRKYGPARAASSAATQRFIIRTEASDAEFNVRVSQHAGFTVTSVVAFPREFRTIFPGISRRSAVAARCSNLNEVRGALTDSA